MQTVSREHRVPIEIGPGIVHHVLLDSGYRVQVLLDHVISAQVPDWFKKREPKINGACTCIVPVVYQSQPFSLLT